MTADSTGSVSDRLLRKLVANAPGAVTRLAQ